jgi:eukaryotic-like serine/threonine-protein kinase
LEEAGGVKALVLELVEGPTLAEKLVTASDGLPVAESLDIGRQIAIALEAAHEAGIIHRDLKPGNIAIRHDGVVKVLDFGLVKAFDVDGVEPNMTNSPTLTLGATRAGIILGTAAYMSPEQASGYAADRRADIWSFGAVLYEMLTGRRAFPGESASDTLATVLKLDPDWAALPAETPASIRTLVRRCLTKDRKQRLQAIGEARIALEHPGEPASVTPALVHSRLGLWTSVAAGVFALALAAVSFLHFRETPSATAPSEPLQRLPIHLRCEGVHIALRAIATGHESVTAVAVDGEADDRSAGRVEASCRIEQDEIEVVGRVAAPVLQPLRVVQSGGERLS